MFRHVFAASALVLALGTAARANEAMVLIESVSAPVAGVTPMTYVRPGATIDLGQSTVLVLDYLGSCVRETVTGGIVHVGARFGQVEHGTVVNDRMDCGGGQLQVAAANSMGGVVYRAVGDIFEIHSTEPVILAGAPGRLTITRLDQNAPAIHLDTSEEGGRAPFAIDLAALHVSLVAGASYRLDLGERQVTIRVDPSASGAEMPLVRRLLPI